MDVIPYGKGDGIRLGQNEIDEARSWLYKPNAEITLLTTETPPRVLARPFRGQIKPNKDVWFSYFGERIA